MMLTTLRQQRRGTKALQLMLAAGFLLPANPALLFAGDGLGARGPKPAAAIRPNLDLALLRSIDIDAETGVLAATFSDAELGWGEKRVALTRTWREAGGLDSLFGRGWASPLGMRLEGLGEDELCFVDEVGQRRWFVKDEAGYEATRGLPARIALGEDGAATLTGLGDELTYSFDAEGRILSRLDSHSRGMRFSYGGGALASVEAFGATARFERGEAGRITTVHLPGEQQLRFSYDANGQVTRAVTADNLAWTYSYDQERRLASINEGSVNVVYDSISRVIRLDGENVRTRRYSYLQSADPWRTWITLAEDEAGRISLVAQSFDRQLIERISEDGKRTTVQLDERDRPIVVLDDMGQKWEYGYDERGRPSISEGPDGTVTTYDYKGESLRPSVVQRGAEKWAFSYDPHGNLNSIKTPAGGEQLMRYDDLGRLQWARDARGLERSYAYDEAGRLISSEDNLGREVRMGYDARGQVSTFQGPDGKVVDVEYDEAGRVAHIQEQGGREVRFEYNRFGKLSARVDERGRKVEYGYNRYGEIQAIRDAVGTIQRFSYDGAGRLEAVTDALGNRTTYTYHKDSYIVTGPNGDQRRYEFGVGDRVREEVLPNGRKVSFDYGKHGMVTRRVNPDGSVALFDYDAKGRMTFMGDSDSEFRLAYDAIGRITSLTDGKLGKTLSYEYNAAGDRTKMVLPFGEVRYDRDLLGQITAITDIDGGRIEIDYTFDGLRKELRYPNGVVTRFDYDGQRRLTEQLTKDAAGKVLSARSYGYDELGRRDSVTNEDGVTERYVYDARGRVVEIRRGDDVERLAYDDADNRVSRTVKGETETYEIGKGNRVLRDGDERFEYDLAGNLVRRITASGVVRYTYDAQDKLIEVSKPNGTTISYGYAPNGTRVWREMNGQRRYYLHDFADVVAEYDAAGKLVRSYTHGPDDDDVLAAHNGKSKSYYHYDAVRSIVAMTNGEGALEARYDWSIFGELRSSEGAAARWNPYGFTSRRMDPAAGLHYFRARYYKADLGRFTSLDPVGFIDGPNRYAYARNNPVLYNDPFGLWSLRGAWDSATSAVSSAWETTKNVAGQAWDVTKQAATHIGKNPLSFAKGFGKGVWNGVKGVYNLVRHPVQTFNGIVYAIENWDETKAALGDMWDAYVDAFHNDPEKFADLTGQVFGELALAIAGTKGLDKVASVAKVANLAKVGNAASRVSRASGLTRAVGSIGPRLSAAGRAVGGRLASAGRTVAGQARALGARIARRAPFVAAAATRIAATAGRATEIIARNATAITNSLKNAATNTASRVRAIDRANKIRLAREAARGGNIVTRNARRVANFPRRVAAAGRLAVREPGAFLAYGAFAMSRGTLKLAAAMGRGTLRMGRRASIPAAIVFDDAITDSINRYESREEALGDVLSQSGSLREDAAKLSPEETRARLDEIGRTYEDYRNNLLKPVHQETTNFDAKLAEFNDALERGDIPDEAAISRMDAAIQEWTRRRDVLLTDLYEGHTDVEHGPDNPSPNRRLAFDDEIDLLKQVRENAAPESQAVIDERIASLEERRDTEHALYRSGEHDDLLGYLAGEEVDIESALGIPGLGAESAELYPQDGGEAPAGVGGQGMSGALSDLFDE